MNRRMRRVHARRLRRDPGGPPREPMYHPVPETDGAAPGCPHCSGSLWWLTHREMVELMVDLGRPPVEAPAGAPLLPVAYPWWFCSDCGHGGALLADVSARLGR